MKALTLHQPWATLIAGGVKTIETRAWPAPDGVVGERIAIHAGMRCTTGTVGEFTVEKDNPRGSAPAYLLRGPIIWPYRLPLGAVVATAIVADCVPMHLDAEIHPAACRLVLDCPDEGDLPHQRGGLWIIGPTHLTGGRPTRVEDQRPYGDYRPGRWAWLLADVERCDPPVPARGYQRVWNWTP